MTAPQQTLEIADGVAGQSFAPASGYASLPPVLDACCGSRMFWFDKKDPRALFVDVRREEYTIEPDAAYKNGSEIVIAPDLQADFTNLPIPSESFSLVVFDPPHKKGQKFSGLLEKKYGLLSGGWKTMISRGFEECFRVLKPNGTLIFKWAESAYPLSDVLALTPHKPLFGHKTRQHSKTHWVAFIKPNDQAKPSARSRKE